MSNGKSLTLLVQTAFLGDLILSIGLMKALRERHPERRLGLVCRRGLGEFFRRVGLVDELYEIQKGEADTYQKAAKQIREYDQVHVYSPHTSVRTAIFVRSLKATSSVGYRKIWNSFAYDKRVIRPQWMPDVLRQMCLLAPEDQVLAENLRQYEASGRAYLRDEKGRLSEVPSWASISLRERLLSDRNSWTALMEKLGWAAWSAKPKALLFPGSQWATKRWTEEGFVATGKSLVKSGAQVLVMGAGNERDVAERIAAKIPGAVAFAGNTNLYESILVIAHSDLLVGNDSASAHMAAVAETPSISVFGPTVVEQGFRPWSNTAYIAEKTGLACRPCGPHGHHVCPRRTHECMTHLAPDQVIATALEILPGVRPS